jgi:hypothetical protein
VGKEIAARLIGARGLPIGLRIWALVARRPIDSLAILTAGVASIVIIINAVFLQPGFRQGTDQSEGLVSKLQKPQEFLKSKGKYLQRDVPLFVEHCEGATAIDVKLRWLGEQARRGLSFLSGALPGRHVALEVACEPSVVGSLWLLPA